VDAPASLLDLREEVSPAQAQVAAWAGGRGAAQGRPLGRVGLLGAGQIEDAHELGPRASVPKSWAVATVGQFDRMAPRTGPQ
jgi:hypothetical protein